MRWGRLISLTLLGRKEGCHTAVNFKRACSGISLPPFEELLLQSRVATARFNEKSEENQGQYQSIALGTGLMWHFKSTFHYQSPASVMLMWSAWSPTLSLQHRKPVQNLGAANSSARVDGYASRKEKHLNLVIWGGIPTLHLTPPALSLQQQQLNIRLT